MIFFRSDKDGQLFQGQTHGDDVENYVNDCWCPPLCIFIVILGLVLPIPL